MKKDEALQIIKSIIDESIKKGIVGNLETAVKIAEAFNFVINNLIEIE